ncbi:MAG: hypothetical protein Q9160_007085 [Pyrenula sp. 1 TL-2023]
MAGTKKKRKPPQNPSRGFQTSSLPSKAKTAATEQRDEQLDALPSGDVVLEAKGQPVSNSTKASQSESREVQNHTVTQHMSPEQLEEHLEQSELQAALAAHGQRIKLEASKAAARLQTERRVLRSQASVLDTGKWLAPELKLHVMNLARHEDFARSTGHPKVIEKALEHLSAEMAMCMRLWRLRRTLTQLKLPYAPAALQNALSFNCADNESKISSKETLWGLDEALAYMALHSEDSAMPPYDTTPTADGKKASSPVHKASSASPNTMTAAYDNRRGEPRGVDREIEETNAANDVLNSTDEDIDPDDLQDRYISVKVELLKIEHGLDMSPVTRVPQEPSKRKRRLQNLLSKIQRDVLFDEQDANENWRLREIEMRKSLFQKKLSPMTSAGSTDENASEHEITEGNATTSNGSSNEEEKEADEEEDASMLGPLFESTEDSGGRSDPLGASKAEDCGVLLRDFGKTIGSPRRILEDVCKVIDSSCTISTKTVSEAAHSNRQSLRIQWTKDREQYLSCNFKPPRVSVHVTARTVEATMQSIATPTYAESVAYISVVVLFCLFAEPAKGEKPYLRLPTVWREVWDSLSAVKQEEINAEDTDALKETRDIVRSSGATPGLAQNVTTLKPKITNEGQGLNNSPLPTRPLTTDVVVSWRHKSTSPTYRHMLQARQNLPIWKSRKEILQAVEAHQVTIISGETGSGKSTQVPSFLLEHDMMAGEDSRILVAEPRRISAISLARRVSEELGEKKSDVGSMKSLVGYAIRLETKTSSSTRVTFATTGVVMRMLENHDALRDTRYIVLDEIHERTMDTDFLLIVLRRLLPKRPHLRLILMSATFDAGKFAEYFGSVGMATPVLKVPGRTFPVQVEYLPDIIEMLKYSRGGYSVTKALLDDDGNAKSDTEEEKSTRSSAGDLEGYSTETRTVLANFDEYRIDCMLIAKAIAFVAKDDNLQQYSKAFLVFLPGIAEIRRCQQTIESESTFDHKWILYVLHSSIPGEDQERAFAQPPPGVRKIVLSTNIAETGITIPDITTVIDSGKERVFRFDERRQLSKLTESFISKASSKQRQGRAARVRPGLALKLYTRDRYERLMPDQTAPEMLRLSLQDPALKIKLYDIGGIEETLANALTPPTTKNIRRAVDALREAKALTTSEELTPLGRQLARLPLDIWLGKIIVTGIAFRCLDCATTVAAILTSKSPFISLERTNAAVNSARETFNRGDSDLLLTYNAYLAWKRALTAGKGQEFFQKYRSLSSQILSNIEDQRAQLIVSLVDARILQLDDEEKSSLRRARLFTQNRHFFVVPSRYDINSTNDIAVNATIASAFYPKLLVREGKGWRAIATNQFIGLSPQSIIRNTSPLPRFVSFYQTMQSKSKNVIATDLSSVHDSAVALFLGDADFKLYAGVIAIDGSRLRFAVRDLQTMVVLMVLRARIQDIITQRVQYPKRALSDRQETWMQVWQNIMEQWSISKRR